MRVLDPRSFSTAATRLDQVVLSTAIEIIGIDAESVEGIHEECLRLSVKNGGCGLQSAQTKCLFAKLASSCLVLPGVAARLLELGCSKDDIASVLDTGAADWCLQQLQQRGVYVRSDGAVQVGVAPTSLLTAAMIPWSQAMRLQSRTPWMNFMPQP